MYATVEKVHPNLEKEETSIKLRDLFSILRNKMVLLTLCGITMYGAGYGSFITVIPAFLISSKRLISECFFPCSMSLSAYHN